LIEVPESERIRFDSLLHGQARLFGLNPTDYLRKIWYHEEASKLGEYVAMTLVDEAINPC
jgi:hypothetical protein